MFLVCWFAFFIRTCGSAGTPDSGSQVSLRWKVAVLMTLPVLYKSLPASWKVAVLMTLPVQYKILPLELLESNPHHARIIVVLRHVISRELCEFSEGELCESCELCEFCEPCELTNF